MSATPDSTLTDAKDNLIADLQRQLAERDAELAEARMQQAASAEVLQVINSSPGDLQPVFDAILQKAHALCGSSLGALFLRDGERFLPAAMRDPELMAAALRQDGMGSDAPVVRPLLSGDSVVHIIDLTLVDHPLARAAVAEGVRTLLSIPLRKGDTLLGMINAARLEVHPFSEKQIALLQNFAAQAVIAMENARLITETREALEQQTATAEVLGVINASPGELKPVFEAMLDRAMTLCGAAFGAFMSYDGNKVYAVATRGLPPDLVDVFREPVAPRRDGDGPYARFLRGEPLQHIVDMAADNVFPSLASRPRALAEIGGARTGLEIPLRKEGVLLRIDLALSPRSTTFLRKTDRSVAELRGPGGHRDGERAAIDRDARSLGAADGDGGSAGGHQRVARRSWASVRRDARKGDAPVRSLTGNVGSLRR